MRRENKGKSKRLRFVLIRLSVSQSVSHRALILSYSRTNRVLRGLLTFVLWLLVHQDILERNVVENNNNHHVELNFSQNHDQHLDKPEEKRRAIFNFMSSFLLNYFVFKFFNISTDECLS